MWNSGKVSLREISDALTQLITFGSTFYSMDGTYGLIVKRWDKFCLTVAPFHKDSLVL